jgi:hypothetical protein
MKMIEIYQGKTTMKVPGPDVEFLLAKGWKAKSDKDKPVATAAKPKVEAVAKTETPKSKETK